MTDSKAAKTTTKRPIQTSSISSLKARHLKKTMPGDYPHPGIVFFRSPNTGVD
jgi:hypothetical protein